MLNVVRSLLLSAFFISACGIVPTIAQDADPDTTAILIDTITPRTDTSADFFFVHRLDGDSVDNAESLTTQKDQGRGFMMTPRNYDRRIPARTTMVEIEGVRHYAAPVLALLHGSYNVSGKESFDAISGHSYEVKGVLQDGDCSVWIEDTATAEIVGQKFNSKC